MPGKDKGLVGIELSHDELRGVYVSRRGNRVEVMSAAHVRMPDGGLSGGVVVQYNIVALALKRVLEEMRVPSGIGVVMGVPSEGIVLRTLNVPQSPDDELATIVAGEVEHYRILRTRGSHAFVALDPPVKLPTGSPRTVVVAAAEEQVTKSLGSLATEANVRLAALEPVEFGLLRAAAAAIGTDESAFVVLIGQQSTDLAAFSKGQLWFYRRVEYGGNQLIPARAHMATIHPFGDELAPPDPAIQKYSPTVLDSLAGEIGRSFDYLGREYKEHAQFGKVNVSVGDADLSDIAPELAERLAIPTDIVPPLGGSDAGSDVAAKIKGGEGMRYSAAFGLAMRNYVTFSGALPRVDLFAGDRATAATLVVRRNITGSLVASAAAILAGVAGVVLYGHQTSIIDAETATSQDHAKALQTEASAATAKHLARDRQIGLLAANGVPATVLLDSIATSLDPDVGIQSLNVTPDKTVTITAEAKSESSMLHTVENIQRIPILQNVMVQTFANRGEQDNGLTFTIAAKTLPVSLVRVLPPPAAQAAGDTAILDKVKADVAASPKPKSKEAVK